MTLISLFVLAAVAPLLYAGDMTVTVTQPFKAAGKSYPAGHYRILADPEEDHINLLNLDKRTKDEVQITTRLTPREGQSGEIVFDRIGNDYYLSEIYIIGMDGIFFMGAPGKHKHLIVKEDEP